MSELIDLELQIQLDIKGVFDDLFEHDDIVEEEEPEMIAVRVSRFLPLPLYAADLDPKRC